MNKLPLPPNISLEYIFSKRWKTLFDSENKDRHEALKYFLDLSHQDENPLELYLIKDKDTKGHYIALIKEDDPIFYREFKNSRYLKLSIIKSELEDNTLKVLKIKTQINTTLYTASVYRHYYHKRDCTISQGKIEFGCDFDDPDFEDPGCNFEMQDIYIEKKKLLEFESNLEISTLHGSITTECSKHNLKQENTIEHRLDKITNYMSTHNEEQFKKYTQEEFWNEIFGKNTYERSTASLTLREARKRNILSKGFLAKRGRPAKY